MLNRFFVNHAQKHIKITFNSSPVRYSAVFISGAKASDNFAFVVPYIDFPERIKQKKILQEELKKRNSNLDIDKIQKLWIIYQELKQQKENYVLKKNEISKELFELTKNNPDSEMINKYKIKVNLIKDNLKKLQGPLWSAEEAAIVEALKLPNILHHNTPQNDNKIIHSHKSPPTFLNNHLKLGSKLKLINLKKNENYYLLGNAAIFELGAKYYFSSRLKQSNFIQFSNPDFVKSVIVEGCGIDHTNPDATFILHHNEQSKVNIDNRLHLLGGGSLCSFMAFYAKNVLNSKVFPLKYFSIGRQYVPSPSEEDSLFHVSQSSVVQVFGVTQNSEDIDRLLCEVMELMKSLYGQLGYHYRMSILSADKLEVWESLRVIVEMYSTSLNTYIEIANISISGNFISKRLMFTYTENKTSFFPHILSGTILNVPKFLGCVLEQKDTFELPKQFAVEKWSV